MGITLIRLRHLQRSNFVIFLILLPWHENSRLTTNRVSRLEIQWNSNTKNVTSIPPYHPSWGRFHPGIGWPGCLEPMLKSFQHVQAGIGWKKCVGPQNPQKCMIFFEIYVSQSTANIQLPGPRANNGCLLSIVDGIGGREAGLLFLFNALGPNAFQSDFTWERSISTRGLSFWIHDDTCNMPRQASLWMQVKILQLFQVLISTIENRCLWMADLCLNQRLWTRHDVSWSVICGADEAKAAAGPFAPGLLSKSNMTSD